MIFTNTLCWDEISVVNSATFPSISDNVFLSGLILITQQTNKKNLLT